MWIMVTCPQKEGVQFEKTPKLFIDVDLSKGYPLGRGQFDKSQ